MAEELKELLDAHASRVSKLTVQRLVASHQEEDGSDDETDYLLIEGDKESLRFLGGFIIAFAEGDLGCTWIFIQVARGLPISAHLLPLESSYTNCHVTKVN